MNWKKLITIAIVIALIYFIIKGIKNLKKSNGNITATEMMQRKNFTEKDAENAIREVNKIYGKDMAQLVERIMRLETNHFKSGQYRLTGSAGMEVGKWANIPKGATDGYIEIDDTAKVGMEKFIVWHSVTDFAKYLAEYIKRYNGNYARWNALDEKLQEQYRKKVMSVKPRFIV